MNLHEHYENSKKEYESIAKVGGESHLSYYMAKYPQNYLNLKRIEAEKNLKLAKETKISSAIDKASIELDALDTTCWKCNETHEELYGDAFCPHCLTHQ